MNRFVLASVTFFKLIDTVQSYLTENFRIIHFVQNKISFSLPAVPYSLVVKLFYCHAWQTWIP